MENQHKVEELLDYTMKKMEVVIQQKRGLEELLDQTVEKLKQFNNIVKSNYISELISEVTEKRDTLHQRTQGK